MLLGGIFSSITKPKPKPTSTANFSSTSSAIGSSGYVSLDAIASAPTNSVIDDVQMDLGLKPKNAAYYRDLEKRSDRSTAMVEQMMASNDNDSSPSTSKPKGPTAAELEAQRKAKALAKRKAEGQKARKKFEKEKGERRIALRKRYMKLLKLT